NWPLVRLGCYLRKIERGWSPVAAEGDLVPDQYAVLTLSAVRRGRFVGRAIKPISETAAVSPGMEIQDGDLLLTRSNTRDLVGDVCIVDGARRRTIFPDLIYRLRIDVARLKPRFLMYFLLSQSGRQQIETDARGS